MKGIDIERLKDVWEQIKQYENFSSNTELFRYINAVNEAEAAIGDPSPDDLQNLSDEEYSMVAAAFEVIQNLKALRKAGRLPPGM